MLLLQLLFQCLAGTLIFLKVKRHIIVDALLHDHMPCLRLVGLLQHLKLGAQVVLSLFAGLQLGVFLISCQVKILIYSGNCSMPTPYVLTRVCSC